MTKFNAQPKIPPEFCHKTETTAHDRWVDPTGLSPDDIRRMFYDLQIHEIELTMQNEELKRIELELEASNARYADLYDTSPAGHFTIGFAGQIVDANLTAAAMLGRERGGLLHHLFSDFICRDSQGTFCHFRNRLYDTGERQECEIRLVRGDFSEFWVRLHATIDRGEKSGAPAFRMAMMDINTYREAQEALRMAERRYREVFESGRDGLVLFDPAGRFLDCNQAYSSLVGYSLEELKELRDFYVITPSRWWKWENEEIWNGRLLGRGFSGIYEKELIRKDGSIFPIEISSYAVRDDQDRLIYLCSVARDITERKRAEAERQRLEDQIQHVQKLESLGTLAGGIAHDFNNILLVILGNADLVGKEIPEHSPARSSLENIISATRRAASLTGQMLAYSGKGQFEIRPVNLSEVAQEIARLLETSVSKSAVLSMQLDQGLPPIDADSSQIQQIIMNLILNAAEALDKQDGGKITMCTGVEQCTREYLERSRLPQKPAAGPYVFLEVSDNGCGMDKVTQEYLFDPFFTTKFTGRGLGMSAVLGIVRGHNGAIIIDSSPGAGTTVRVLFPPAPEQQK